MKQQSKKGKQVWLKVLLTVIGVLLLIPAVLYAYLSYDHFRIDEKRADYDISAPYTGEAVYQANGDVKIPLEAEDLYWLIDEYQLLNELSIYDIDCRKVAVDIDDSKLTVYANLLYKGILPLPLRVDLSIQGSAVLNISVVSAHIGKWFEIPTEILAKLGMENQYNISCDELLTDTLITSIVFENKGIIVTGPFLSEFSQEINPDMTADTLLLYGAENDETINQASACYRADSGNVRGQIIRNYVASAQKPVDALVRLLSLCDTTTASEAINTLDAFRARFFFPSSIEDVSAYRNTYIEKIALYNRKLEAMLTKVREKYKALEIKLTRDAYEDTTTNKTLSLAALYPDLGLDDSQCHPVLFIATEPLKSPYTADLPLFSQIPQSPRLKLDMTRDYLSNDIGVMLMLPDGSTAMIYYASTSELVVQCLPQATAANLFEEYRVPKVLNLDLAIFSTERIRHDAPAPDLSQYIMFLPWDIEKVWLSKTE